MSRIRVEFYGVPRLRIGAAHVSSQGDSLGEVLADLASRFPQFADDCLSDLGADDWALNDFVAASIGGHRFVRDAATPLEEDDVLLIMSTDAGG